MIDPLSDAAFTDLASMHLAEEDRRARVRFFLAPVKDARASELRGRPVYQVVEMCERKPDPQTIICERVDRMQPDPRRLFPIKYAQFKAEAAEKIEGTLLSAWGLIDVAEVEGYKAIGILTVEQLAAISDSDLEKRKIEASHRQRAKDFLAMAKGMEPLAQARAENAHLRAEIQVLRETIEALGGKVSAPPPPTAIPDAPKRRGRPPKAKPAEAQEH